MIHNNYFSVADDDRKWFYDSLKNIKIGSYNRQTVDCQQITEKVMKGIVEELDISVVDKRELLHTNDLRKLGEILNRELQINLDISDLSYLKDFYFEARYPGDKFSCATEEERDKCKEIMERTLKQLQPFIEGYDFSNEPLLSMDSF